MSDYRKKIDHRLSRSARQTRDMRSLPQNFGVSNTVVCTSPIQTVMCWSNRRWSTLRYREFHFCREHFVWPVNSCENDGKLCFHFSNSVNVAKAITVQVVEGNTSETLFNCCCSSRLVQLEPDNKFNAIPFATAGNSRTCPFICTTSPTNREVLGTVMKHQCDDDGEC